MLYSAEVAAGKLLGIQDAVIDMDGPSKTQAIIERVLSAQMTSELSDIPVEDLVEAVVRSESFINSERHQEVIENKVRKALTNPAACPRTRRRFV